MLIVTDVRFVNINHICAYKALSGCVLYLQNRRRRAR